MTKLSCNFFSNTLVNPTLVHGNVECISLREKALERFNKIISNRFEMMEKNTVKGTSNYQIHSDKKFEENSKFYW